ncbi:MAG: gliding motility protein GldC [Chitinophagaceae bacterium]|nr:gliding motility protein GldC [Chitinophagaceae bacterium]MCW5904401.1 gliding motility protein GldC [Chitinophagaceae bacterium]
MQKSTITIDVHLNENKIPEHIKWTADNSSAQVPQSAKAMMLSMWDSADKAALRIDLWVKDMMVDEMSDFYYQTLMGMADTYERATHDANLATDVRNFAKEFYQKFRAQQLKDNKA